MSASDAGWEFGVAVRREGVSAPRADDFTPADKRVSAHWVDDKSRLEYRTAESNEAYLRTDTPVLSIQNYR